MTAALGARSRAPPARSPATCSNVGSMRASPVLALFLALAACSDTEAWRGETPLPSPSGGGLAVPPAAVEASAGPPMPVPYRARGDAAVALNAGCVGCHPDQAAEWRGSLHARAASDGAYRRALAREPSAFCRGCHAPE